MCTEQGLKRFYLGSPFIFLSLISAPLERGYCLGTIQVQALTFQSEGPTPTMYLWSDGRAENRIGKQDSWPQGVYNLIFQEFWTQRFLPLNLRGTVLSHLGVYFQISRLPWNSPLSILGRYFWAMQLIHLSKCFLWMTFDSSRLRIAFYSILGSSLGWNLGLLRVEAVMEEFVKKQKISGFL